MTADDVGYVTVDISIKEDTLKGKTVDMQHGDGIDILLNPEKRNHSEKVSYIWCLTAPGHYHNVISHCLNVLLASTDSKLTNLC